MAVDFSIGKFFVPVSIARFRQLFRKMQWQSSEELTAYQNERLRVILAHAHATVPYYRDLFDRIKLRPAQIGSIADLASLPVLTKDLLRNPPSPLMSSASARYRPFAVSTSGTSGSPLKIHLDRASNGMEFAYYWRYWNWAGYRLGDRFAEFSAQYFYRYPHRIQESFSFQRLSGRILVNSLSLSQSRALEISELLHRTECRFLKGVPSVLNEFARFLAKNPPKFRLRAVFSNGEVLLPAFRKNIEAVFGCPVRDSYGHMERAVAACECEHGRLHINSDYGLAEFIPVEGPASVPGHVRARIVATGLHNFSMPLIRYEVGDTVELDPAQPPCPCGRAFPVISRVEGRSNDVVRTPDGRVVTQLFHVLGQASGVRWGQIVQESVNEITVNVLPEDGTDLAALERELHAFVRPFVGDTMQVRVVFVSAEDATGKARKYRAVISRLS